MSSSGRGRCGINTNGCDGESVVGVGVGDEERKELAIESKDGWVGIGGSAKTRSRSASLFVCFAGFPSLSQRLGGGLGARNRQEGGAGGWERMMERLRCGIAESQRWRNGTSGQPQE